MGKNGPGKYPLALQMTEPAFESTAEVPTDPVTPAGTGHPEPLTPAVVERLFAEHNRSLIRFLRTRLKSDQEAKDVAQEAYVRLLQIDQPGTVSFLRADLFRTAVNIATDRMRGRAPGTWRTRGRCLLRTIVQVRS